MTSFDTILMECYIHKQKDEQSLVLLQNVSTEISYDFLCAIITAAVDKINKMTDSHWSMFTSDCRWQRRLAIRYNVGFLEQNGCTHLKTSGNGSYFHFC